MLIAKSWIFKDNKVNLIYQEQIYDEKSPYQEKDNGSWDPITTWQILNAIIDLLFLWSTSFATKECWGPFLSNNNTNYN